MTGHNGSIINIVTANIIIIKGPKIEARRADSGVGFLGREAVSLFPRPHQQGDLESAVSFPSVV